MVNNSESFRVKYMQLANSMPLGTGRINALAVWGLATHSWSDWDHKPDLTRMLSLQQGGKHGDFYFPVEGDAGHEFFYDIWSNIHYGYVGLAAGFDEGTLLTGASLSWIPGVGRDDPYDELSVKIGFMLWKMTGGDPSLLTEEMILELITAHADEYQRLYEQHQIGDGVVIDDVNGN